MPGCAYTDRILIFFANSKWIYRKISGAPVFSAARPPGKAPKNSRLGFSRTQLPTDMAAPAREPGNKADRSARDWHNGFLFFELEFSKNFLYLHFVFRSVTWNCLLEFVPWINTARAYEATYFYPGISLRWRLLTKFCKPLWKFRTASG